MALKIGEVCVEPPLALAPMAGITTSVFRRIVKECGGCGIVFTELVSASGVLYGSRQARELLRFTEIERPVAIQLFGADPSRVAAAAVEVAGHGPDVIDLNMGCPARKVIRMGAGAALLQDPQRAEAMVRRTVAAISLPVTVKLRSPADGGQQALVELARRLQDAGPAALCVHARPPCQKHGGPARWDDIRAVKEAVSVPVIGNGGVRRAYDAIRMMAETGCDGVMIGTAARGDPWIFSRIAALLDGQPEPHAPTPHQRLAMALRHARALAEEKGARRAMSEMRLHISSYIRDLPGARQLRERVNKAQTFAELESIVQLAAQRTRGDEAPVGGSVPESLDTAYQGAETWPF